MSRSGCSLLSSIAASPTAAPSSASGPQLSALVVGGACLTATLASPTLGPPFPSVATFLPCSYWAMSSAFLVTLWSENAERAGRHLADWYPHSADKEMAERVGAHSQPQGRWPEGPRRPRSPPTVCRHPPGAMLQAGRAGHSQGCGRALLRAAWGCRRLVGGVAWASGGGRALPWLGGV